MIKTFAFVCACALAVVAGACSNAPAGTTVTPTIGTVATAQGTVMRAGTYNPLAGVTITVAGVHLETASDGTFAVSGLKPGDTVLTAERQGFDRFSERVNLEGARTFTIFLTPSGLPSSTTR